MTSQIRSHIEYLMQTYNVLLLILHSKLMKNIASLTVLIWFNDDDWQWHSFMGHPVYAVTRQTLHQPCMAAATHSQRHRLPDVPVHPARPNRALARERYRWWVDVEFFLRCIRYSVEKFVRKFHHFIRYSAETLYCGLSESFSVIFATSWH